MAKSYFTSKEMPRQQVDPHEDTETSVAHTTGVGDENPNNKSIHTRILKQL